METVGDLTDRVLRDWLYPADSQPMRAVLSSDINATTTNIPYDPAPMFQEEELLLGPGTVVEIDREQVLVHDVDPEQEAIVACTRKANGTTATTHDAGTFLTISPPFTRMAVFEAIQEAISALSPRIPRRRAVSLTLNSNYTPAPADLELPESFTYLRSGLVVRAPLRAVDLLTLPTGKAIQVMADPGTTGTLVYRGHFTAPASEDDYLKADLGITPDLHRAIQLRAVAHLAGSRDFANMTADYLTQQIEAQNVEVGTGASLRQAVLRYYEYEMAELSRRVKPVRFHNGWTGWN